MAVITPTQTDANNQTRQITWLGLGNADQGQGVAFGQFPDRTIGIQGTFGGATVTIQGSMDGGTIWYTLTDHLGNPLVFTANALALIAENPALMRPITAGGSGTTINIYLLGTRTG